MPTGAPYQDPNPTHARRVRPVPDVRSTSRRAAWATVAFAAALRLTAPALADEIDLASWASHLPAHFHLSGVKTEPTYLVAIDIWRDGEVFTIRGGAPAWAERSIEAVTVDAAGKITHKMCPKGMVCTAATHPAGFLATAALVAAMRSGMLAGRGQVEPFGPFQVVCVAGEELGIERPILDPCFEVTTGAAIAQKHRQSHAFDGPTLEPSSVRFEREPAPHPSPDRPSSNPRDKAT